MFEPPKTLRDVLLKADTQAIIDRFKKLSKDYSPMVLMHDKDGRAKMERLMNEELPINTFKELEVIGGNLVDTLVALGVTTDGHKMQFSEEKPAAHLVLQVMELAPFMLKKGVKDDSAFDRAQLEEVMGRLQEKLISSVSRMKAG
jgi:hypothetical protein